MISKMSIDSLTHETALVMFDCFFSAFNIPWEAGVTIDMFCQSIRNIKPASAKDFALLFRTLLKPREVSLTVSPVVLTVVDVSF